MRSSLDKLDASFGAIHFRNYQRLPRAPPPPPKPPRLRPAPPPKPPRPSRGAIGFASLTVIGRPSKSAPLYFSIALCASASVDISTKPKPLRRPEARSVMIFAL